MVLYFKCYRTNGVLVGNFSGFYADEAALKGFSRIVRHESLDNGDSVNFTITCDDEKDKNRYYYEGKREHGVDTVELKIIFATKIFIVDYISEFDDLDDYCIVRNETSGNVDILEVSKVVLQV